MDNNVFNEMFVAESIQMIDNIEKCIIDVESKNVSETKAVNELFRFMHTIKGSSAMMGFDSISAVAHALEDVFSFIRDNDASGLNYGKIADLALMASDFMKKEIKKAEKNKLPDGNNKKVIKEINSYLDELKNKDNGNNENTQTVEITVFFEKDCPMVNVRAFSLLKNIREKFNVEYYLPDNLKDNDSISFIEENGFKIAAAGLSEKEAEKVIKKAVMIEKYEISKKEEKTRQDTISTDKNDINEIHEIKNVNISVSKINNLMDLVGELSVSSAAITDIIKGKKSLENEDKILRNYLNITREIQDVAMSMRLFPIDMVFKRMYRVIRDIARKTGKEVIFETYGNDIEVDKDIIENISDPLMHLLRNAVDHGIEDEKTRLKKGKPKKGKVTLTAVNEGGNVTIIVNDDGTGINKSEIIKKAQNRGILSDKKNIKKMDDNEIYEIILLPGFSTKENVTEFSGRGVGMDVVTSNINKVDGHISIESNENKGTSIKLKIPITLSIVLSMIFKLNDRVYAFPVNNVVECISMENAKIINDTRGNETLSLRNMIVPVFNLNKMFESKDIKEQQPTSIIVIKNSENRVYAFYTDSLLGEQDIVVKPVPKILRGSGSISGCAVMGDSNICFVMNVNRLTEYAEKL